MEKETEMGILAGASSGNITLTGMVLRLPAPSSTGLLEKEISIPGSEVMFSSSINSWESE